MIDEATRWKRCQWLRNAVYTCPVNVSGWFIRFLFVVLFGPVCTCMCADMTDGGSSLRLVLGLERVRADQECTDALNCAGPINPYSHLITQTNPSAAIESESRMLIYLFPLVCAAAAAAWFGSLQPSQRFPENGGRKEHFRNMTYCCHLGHCQEWDIECERHGERCSWTRKHTIGSYSYSNEVQTDSRKLHLMSITEPSIIIVGVVSTSHGKNVVAQSGCVCKY